MFGATAVPRGWGSVGARGHQPPPWGGRCEAALESHQYVMGSAGPDQPPQAPQADVRDLPLPCGVSGLCRVGRVDFSGVF